MRQCVSVGRKFCGLQRRQANQSFDRLEANPAATAAFVMNGAGAQFGIVLLISSEISEGKRIFRNRHHPQIALNAGTKPHTRFGLRPRIKLGDSRPQEKFPEIRA
jgi:hypothetical protein